MKKSSTTMNVPARTTGRRVQRLAKMRGRTPGPAAGEEICWVLIPSTMPCQGSAVDYLPGSTCTGRGLRCQANSTQGQLSSDEAS